MTADMYNSFRFDVLLVSTYGNNIIQHISTVVYADHVAIVAKDTRDSKETYSRLEMYNLIILTKHGSLNKSSKS